ncbi:hypothetical protein [Guggenheimella bovis]
MENNIENPTPQSPTPNPNNEKAKEILGNIGAGIIAYFLELKDYWKADRRENNVLFAIFHILFMSLFYALSLSLTMKIGFTFFLKMFFLEVLMIAILFFLAYGIKKLLLKTNESLLEAFQLFAPAMIIPLIVCFVMMILSIFGISIYDLMSISLFITLAPVMAAIFMLLHNEASSDLNWIALLLIFFLVSLFSNFVMSSITTSIFGSFLGGF